MYYSTSKIFLVVLRLLQRCCTSHTIYSRDSTIRLHVQHWYDNACRIIGDHERADAQNVQAAAVYEEVGANRYLNYGCHLEAKQASYLARL